MAHISFINHQILSSKKRFPANHLLNGFYMILFLCILLRNIFFLNVYQTHFVALDVFCCYIFSITGVILVNLFYKCFINYFLCSIFSYLWTYVCLHVIFLSLFYSFFEIARFLLVASAMTNTKITCIITVFTIIFWLITKFLLGNYKIKLTCFYNAFTLYLTSIPNNVITHRVIMFP